MAMYSKKSAECCPKMDSVKNKTFLSEHQSAKIKKLEMCEKK